MRRACLEEKPFPDFSPFFEAFADKLASGIEPLGDVE
jgi:hypothetical protein